jgi:hypothetical protein
MSKKFTTEKIIDLANKYNLQIKAQPQFKICQFYLPDQEIDYDIPPLFQINPEQDWNKEYFFAIYDAFTIRLDGFQKTKIVYGSSRCVHDMEELDFIVSYMVMLYTKWLEVKKQFAEGWNLINIKKDF